VFTAGTIFFVHNFWDMTGDAYEQNMIQALKNLSIIGGLLLIVAVGRRAPDQASASYFGKPPR
jgi:putative oxidoreductase